MEKFHQLRSEKVLTAFHIKKIKNCEHLDELLTGQTTLTSVEKAILDMALERYEQTSDGWNEEELKMNFISAILMVANPNIPSVCKIFFERPLSGVINNYELYVKTDCFVASYNEAASSCFFARFTLNFFRAFKMVLASSTNSFNSSEAEWMFNGCSAGSNSKAPIPRFPV